MVKQLFSHLHNFQDQFFTYIQALWLTVHLFRLILTVEPCNMTHIEVSFFLLNIREYY
jgi:hypothetical protein